MKTQEWCDHITGMSDADILCIASPNSKDRTDREATILAAFWRSYLVTFLQNAGAGK